MKNQDRALLILKQIKGIGINTLNKIPETVLEKLDNPKDIQEYLKSAKIAYKRESVANISLDEIKIAMEKANTILCKDLEKDVQFITKFDQEKYPLQFKRLEHQPPFFFARGDVPILKSPGIAVIGTRVPSTEAYMRGMALTEKIVAAGFSVVSGLALGADSCAHNSCINAGGKTIAVVPSSVHKIYPQENKALANRILEQGGCVISEYPFGHRIVTSDFIARDRLQSGLAMGVAVLETAVDGGSMHAVETAWKINIPVGLLEFAEEYYLRNRQAGGNRKFLAEKKGFPLSTDESIAYFLNQCQQKSDIWQNNLQIGCEQKLF